MRTKCASYLLATVFAAMAIPCAQAELQNVEVGDGLMIRRSDAPQVNIEARVYQVLTSVTENGPTAKNLRGMDGWLQQIHQRLDDVDLVMDGATLTWNGKSDPDQPRILALGMPRLITRAGEAAEVNIGSAEPVQYMLPNGPGRYVLQALKPGDLDEVGLSLSVTPSTGGAKDGLLDMDLHFHYAWIREREKIAGVNLEVGKPILGHANTAGPVQVRLGEWSCYQTQLGVEGMLYVFLKANEVPRDGTAITPVPAPVAIGSPEPADGGDKARGVASGIGLKNIEVHGSTKIRMDYRSGGHKQ